MNDPASQTQFHREIAKKLCEFPQELERENYLTAVARQFMINPDQLRKLVLSYAAKLGGVSENVKPKPTVNQKKNPEDAGKTDQRLLLTWIVDEPSIYRKIEKYINISDFTDELYQKTAQRLFEDLKKGQWNPAAIISMFEDEEQQREVASIFNTKLSEVNTKQEKERAIQDILYKVKQNSYNYYNERLGSDISAITKALEGKRSLEELRKVHISLD